MDEATKNEALRLMAEISDTIGARGEAISGRFDRMHARFDAIDRNLDLVAERRAARRAARQRAP